MTQLTKAAQARLDGVRYVASLVGRRDDETLAGEWDRVVSVVDVLEALGSGRDWREAVGVARAQLATASEEIVREWGKAHVMVVLVELAGHVGR